MHEYTGHFDGGSNPQVSPQDGSATPPPGPMPGTEPIPDAESGGSPRSHRSGSGSRIQAKLPSWDTRAKLAVVVSFVVLVTVLVMNRSRLKSKDTSTPLAEISKRSRTEKPEREADSTKPDDRAAVKEESESPPSAPTAAADPDPLKRDKPPATADPIVAAAPEPPADAPPKDTTVDEEKKPAKFADGKEEPPSLEAPAKPGERKVVAETLADAPVPALEDKKQKDAPTTDDDKAPRPEGNKPSTPEPADRVFDKPAGDEPAAPTSSMPPLRKAPSTAEPSRLGATDAPSAGSTDASVEGRFTIPSAGLVRTADSAGTKPVAIDAVVRIPSSKPAASMPGTGDDDGTLHVVRRGENFWTIARYHYASGRFYKALWYANRDLAKTPEDLYVGTAIRIPPVEDLNRELIEAPKTARAEARPSAGAPARKVSPRDGRAERAAVEGEPQAALPKDKKDSPKAIPRRSEARPNREPEATYRTYIVRGRNETLRSVARTELGDSDRDVEIEALNRDEFSDDSTRLRVGMTLKLPSDSRTR